MKITNTQHYKKLSKELMKEIAKTLRNALTLRIAVLLLAIHACAFGLTCATCQAQKYVEYTVKKKDTIFGIARDHGITLQQLINMNPQMNQPGYQLKKGDVVRIPVGDKTIHLGVMLPLHNDNGDGRRMVEYYRGVLMACDSMKKEGISVDVHAWNLPEKGKAEHVLNDPEAKQMDIIIGPLYSRFMEPMGNFAKKNDIMLVVPFSINAPQIGSNKHIFQVYQAPQTIDEATARRTAEWFRDYHPIIVDCHDSTSTKGAFTTALRQHLEKHDILYNVTSLSTAEDNFAKAFVANAPNLVVLNTARSKELLTTFAKLKRLSARRPNLEIAMLGYTEWMMYTDKQEDNFHRFNVYVPSYFYTNTKKAATRRLEKKYEATFGLKMQQDALPRFAITGFDHAVFFLRGLHKYGKTFDGAAARFGYQPVQTPLRFEQVKAGGGYQNHAYMFVHYKTDGNIETINY